MKIFINGATGFVGASLVRYFSRLGHVVEASGRSTQPPEALKQYASWRSWNVAASPQPIKAELAIHVAGLASDGARWTDYEAVNITGTRNFMQSARDCPKIAIISSSSVYQFGSTAATEADPIRLESLCLYGRSKYLAEQEVATWAQPSQQIAIFRPRAIYGIGDRILLPKLLNLEKGGRLLLPLRKGVITSLTHVDNLAEAIRLFSLLQLPDQLHTFNIADEETYSLSHVIESIFKEYRGKALPVIPIAPGIIQPLITLNQRLKFHSSLTPMMWQVISADAVMDISRSQTLLHYRAVSNFRKAIPEIMKWVKQFGSKQNFLKNTDDAPWLYTER